MKISFDSLMRQNCTRFRRHTYQLPIKKMQTGAIFVVWNAYERYCPDNGVLALNFNFVIRNHVIVENPLGDYHLWEQLESQLSREQLKWMHYHIFDNIPEENVAKLEKVPVEVVKNWGKSVKKKLWNVIDEMEMGVIS